jgi:transposase
MVVALRKDACPKAWRRVKRMPSRRICLLHAGQQADTPEQVRALASLQELDIVWQQQFAQQEGMVRLRNKDDLPPNAERHDSPYDPEVRYSTKRDLHVVSRAGTVYACPADASPVDRASPSRA